MVDLAYFIYLVVDLVRYIYDLRVLLFGSWIPIGSLIVWGTVGTIFLSHFWKWYDV